jgi:hypothetical protein
MVNVQLSRIVGRNESGSILHIGIQPRGDFDQWQEILEQAFAQVMGWA